MNARSGREVDELWRRFHEVVNMTSRELIDWLWMEPDLVPQPGPPQPPPLGVAVLKLLGKRRVDLTEDDLETMRKVIEVVEDETADVPYERMLADERRRHRLLNVGHDPLRRHRPV